MYSQCKNEHDERKTSLINNINEEEEEKEQINRLPTYKLL